MILPFSTQLNGKPTMFTNRIVKSMWQNYPNQMREHALSVPLPEYYVFEDLTVFQEENLSPKIHTIRTDEKNRWKPGILIDFFINCRQKNMFRFAPRVPVVSTQEVFMTYTHSDLIQISIDGRELFGYSERLEFAQNDGFDTWEDFFNYFYPQIMAAEKKVYKPKLIHWTDFKY